MIEILLVIVIILLIVNIYISIKPQGVDMGPVQRDMEQKLISVEKALREEFTVNREESRKNEQSNRTEIGSSIEKLSATMTVNKLKKAIGNLLPIARYFQYLTTLFNTTIHVQLIHIRQFHVYKLLKFHQCLYF